MKCTGWFVLTCFSCRTEQLPPPNYLPDVATVDDCVAADERLHALDCKHKDGTPWHTSPAGVPFREFCQRNRADVYARCIARVSTCAQIEGAARGECQQ